MWSAEQPPSGLRAMLALALENVPDAALPAFQDAGVALHLALDLRLQARLSGLGEVLPVCRNRRVGMQHSRQRSARLGVVALRNAEDAVQQGPMPLTQCINHGVSHRFLCVEAILKMFPGNVSWKQ